MRIIRDEYIVVFLSLCFPCIGKVSEGLFGFDQYQNSAQIEKTSEKILDFSKVIFF